MSRLIDADELKKAFIGNRYGTKAIEYVIDDAPTIDAVPVIRCKDCEHYSAFHMDCYRIGNIHPRKDDYCSWAKRKEE